ncbi:MAG TPA: SUMF1/EgtB/PvdO family nonheme iron enzyme, partial [Longimicrobiales bacterium]|nr:SUMF1/EgtB/PvdO family nonheme iron enzyme [Longimicrobiales bacterium]
MTQSTHKRSLWQVLGVYAAASWGCLQVVDVLTQNIALPGWVFTLTLAILGLGLPVTAATAYLQGVGRTAKEPADRRGGAEGSSFQRLFTWSNVFRGAVGAMAVWGVAVTAWMVLGRNAASQWDAVTGLDEVRRLVSIRDFGAAYSLAGELDGVIDNDSVRAQMWSEVARPVTVQTVPEGARVLRKYYDHPDADWEEMGRTPLTVERFPFGLHRIRLELDGYVPRETAAYSGALAESPPFILDTPESLPGGMVRVSGGSVSISAPGLEQIKPLEVGDYFLAAHEVTNREYKVFVDAGGYGDSTCWSHPFVDQGQPLSREEAMARFTDRTGRPGPSSWEVGSYPQGADDLPVGGVSWYEAEAYACFMGKALPTVYHWFWEADPFSSNFVVPVSNFGESGPVAVGTSGGVSRAGVFDMAGNVREWTRNELGEDRFNLGGGWNDLSYAFNDAVTSPAFDRSSSNGIRLAAYPDTTNLAAASA